jgi:predicted nucleic acid-binding protein
MISTAVVDSGPLLAVANRADPDHEACRHVLSDPTFRLVIPVLCVAEVSYLLGRRQGPRIEARFLRGLSALDVRAPDEHGWNRIGELVERYSDFPLGGVDASVAALAESLETDLIVTLDRRHFSVLEGVHGRRFRLLPAPQP